MKEERTCAYCGNSIDHKHPNARFCNKKHKDRFHNINNARGYEKPLRQDELSIDEYNDSVHPFDPEAFGDKNV